MACCVSVAGRWELTATDSLLCSFKMGRTTKADGWPEVATAFFDSTALPAPSSTRSKIAETPSISSAICG